MFGRFKYVSITLLLLSCQNCLYTISRWLLSYNMKKLPQF